MIEAVLFDFGDTLIVEEAVGGRHLWEVKLKKTPDVDEVLRELKQHYKLGIITNTVTSREQQVRMALRRKPWPHAYASQHQTRSENSFTAICFQTVT